MKSKGRIWDTGNRLLRLLDKEVRSDPYLSRMARAKPKSWKDLFRLQSKGHK